MIRKGEMGRIDVIPPDEQNRKPRMQVAGRKGVKKNSLKKAVREAILLWINISNEEAKAKH